MPHLLKKLLTFFLVSLSYFLLGYFGIQLATINNFTSPIWPASGLAIGSLLYFGNWLAPAIFIGSLLTNLTIDGPVSGLVVCAVGNMLESLIGSQIILWGLRKNYFRNYSEVFIVFFAATIASVVSASIGVFALISTGVIPTLDWSSSWYTWWSGNAIGILLVTPFFLELLSSPKETVVVNKERLLIALSICAFILLATFLVFVKGFNQAISWTLTPFLMILGLLLGRLFSRFFLILISLVIFTFTLYGYGPFELGNINTNLLYVQTLLSSYAIAILFVKPLNTKYKIGLNYIIGISFGWLILFSVIFQVTVFEKEQRLTDLDKSTQIAIYTVNRMNTRYESVLKGAGSLFQVKPKLERKDFKAYTDAMDFKKYFDATLGIGFAERVLTKDLEAFAKKENLRITYHSLQTAKNYDDHYIIKFLEPEEGNRFALGLDIGSEMHRRQAIDKVIKTNDVMATDSITLVQDNEKRNAFLILNPIWDEQENLLGLTYVPVLTPSFFGKALVQFNHHLRVRISKFGKPIYSTNSSLDEEFKKDMFYRKKTITLFGLKHDIEFYPTDQFFSSHSGSSATLAMLMNVFLLFISAFLLEQLTFGQRAEALVEERTKELEVSKMQLINSSKMASLGEMASGVAHEINNPLAIIQGKVKVITMILEDLNINQPMLFQEVQKIKLTTDRIEKIVKGLRNFSRASNNDPFEPTPLQKIVNETLDLCQEKFKANGIKLKIQDIPDTQIICRASQISQVLINLLNNSSDAIELLSEKWIEIKFEIKDRNQISIFVTDSGPGIPRDHLEKIMEPFFTTKEVSKGTGLGLSIARSIIESHKGQLWVDTSYPNTRFVIELFITGS